MRILYASCLCSKNKYNKLFGKSKFKPGQQVQKYHRLIVEGLAKNRVSVITVTALPVTRKNCSKRFLRFEKENIDDVNYTYLSLFNLPVLKNMMIFLNSFIYTFILCAKDKEVVVIGDVLNISVCAGALCAAKIMRKHNIGIVTDIPSFLSHDSKKITVQINNRLINLFDSYLFLTEEMNKLINKKNKPYIVIEGQVDINMMDIFNSLDGKDKKKVCIYAGGLQKIYGIETLAKAFIKADIESAELHFYGNGDFEVELSKICRLHTNIKYFGVMPNDYVVREQLKATLLINPRPTDEEYTKYSFPSKNMEYMVSGTPVLTTKLPGMPEEYNKYVYLIKEESIEGLSHSLKAILSKDRIELHEKGLKAKEFVLKEKNNVVQANKIIKMINKNTM